MRYTENACNLRIFVLLGRCFQTVPSSRGLGRGPLKAATRVRIPLGSPIQTAVMEMAAFSFISKAFSKFGCPFFEDRCLGHFYEFIYSCFSIVSKAFLFLVVLICY